MKEKKVALLIETSGAYGRGLLEGIAHYHQQARSNWSLFIEPAGLSDRPPNWINQWQGDGILARINDRPMARRLKKLKIPMVDLRGIVPRVNVPFVGVDNHSVAETAFKHFQNRGFRSFAIVSSPKGYHKHMDERCLYFRALAKKAGYDCQVFRETRFGNPDMPWEQQQEYTAEWLRALELPHPIGMLCVNDLAARETIEACHRADLSVPEKIAVLGVDNDNYLCTLSTPPMSSVAVDAPAIGYKAAQLLDRMMSQRKSTVPPETLLPCKDVVVRASTDIFAIDDAVVTEALSFIRDQACQNIGVNDVVATTPLCRTLLERRFKQSLGRSVYEELLRVKLEKAQDLLRSTDLPMSDVAEVSGFQSSIYLSQVFRRELNITPGQWRKQHSIN